MKLPITGAYTMPSLRLNAQTCINLFPVAGDQSSKEPGNYILENFPGLALFADNEGGVRERGLLAYNNVLYAVLDNKFYSISSSGTLTVLGTIADLTTNVQMVVNGTQILINDNTNRYVYTIATNDFVTLGSIGYIGTSIATSYQDGYAFIMVAETLNIFYSNLYDFTTWDALDYFSINTNADYLQGGISFNQEMWFFNTSVAEVWYNQAVYDAAGNVLNPFSKRQGVIINMGLAAPQSLAKSQNSLFWLGLDKSGNGLVMMAQGYNPQIVSTDAINFAISQYAVIDDAIGYCYTDRGHTFYQLTFPNANSTWVYDLTTGLWSQRQSLLTSAGLTSSTQLGRHLSNHYAFCYDKHIVGDFRSATLYIMDPTYVTDDGVYITREKTFLHLANEINYVSLYNFRLEIEPGYAAQTGQGVNPQIMLQVSKDGGFTWGPERWRSAGRAGQYRLYPTWPSLGMGKDLIMRVRMTDPIQWKIIEARVDVESSS